MSDNYPPAVGGLERTVQALARALAVQGDQVHVATLARPDSPARTCDGPIRVHRISGLARHLSGRSAAHGHQFHPTVPDPLLLPRLQRIVSDFQPDIVHAHGWMVNSCLSLRLPAHTRLVTTLHDYGLVCAKKTLTYREILDVACAGPRLTRCLRCAGESYGVARGTLLSAGLAGSRHLLGKVSMFLPISDAVAQASLEGVDPARIRIIPSFVPDDVFEEAAGPRPDFVPAEGYLLYVGALSRHKGLDVLLRAQRRLSAGVPLVLVGPGHPDTAGILGAVTGSSPHPVSIHTDVPHPQIMAAFRSALITVVPSRWPEPLGLVAIEAMAAGCPVVASAVGGLTELVGDDAGGELVAPGDEDALVNSLDDLIADPVRRAELARRGPARAARYTAAEVIPLVRAAYTDVLARAA